MAAGWTNPHTFIQQVIANFRAGGGIAGGETFDSLPTDQGDARLEYSTSVGGNDIHNFSLAQVRLTERFGTGRICGSRSASSAGESRAWSSTTRSTYRSAASGIGLLGRTTSNELASIPFFASRGWRRPPA